MVNVAITGAEKMIVGRFQCGDLGVVRVEENLPGRYGWCWFHVGGCYWVRNMTSVFGTHFVWWSAESSRCTIAAM